jgi:hypothetical protein
MNKKILLDVLVAAWMIVVGACFLLCVILPKLQGRI